MYHSSTLQFRQFPFFSEEIVTLLQKNGFATLESVIDYCSSSSSSSSTVAAVTSPNTPSNKKVLSLANNSKNKIVQLFHSASLDALTVHSFLKKILELPALSVKSFLKDPQSIGGEEEESVSFSSASQVKNQGSSNVIQVIPSHSSKEDSIRLKANPFYELEIHLSNVNFDSSMRNYQMIENWWIVLYKDFSNSSDTIGLKTAELLAMKKLGKQTRATARVSLNFRLSKEEGNKEKQFSLKLMILNDYMIGLQSVDSLPLIIVE
jgi:hypothetical protein